MTEHQVKATCPLCQKLFRTIVHNIKENYEFEQYHIFQHLRVPPGAGAATLRGTTQVITKYAWNQHAPFTIAYQQ